MGNNIKLKTLEVNEHDNIMTAMAKGGLEGTINASINFGALWGVLLIAGKLYGKVKSNKEVEAE